MLRVAPLAAGGGNLVVVAGARHESIILAQLAAIGVQARIILEPEARDSAPAMAAAAAWIAGDDAAGIAAFVSSDHHVPDAAAFRLAVLEAARAARDGRLVTLGVTPTAPSTAYGYIRPSGAGLCPVEAFVEKPGPAAAAAYVASGYLWNTGNFIVQASTLLEEVRAFAPQVEAAASASLKAGIRGEVIHLDAIFAEAPKISIDYAVMEHTSRASVLPVEFAWSDVGAWDAVAATGLGAKGTPVLLNADHCLVRAPAGVLVAVVGLSHIAVVVEADSVLVCNLEDAQSVKAVVDRARRLTPEPFE